MSNMTAQLVRSTFGYGVATAIVSLLLASQLVPDFSGSWVLKVVFLIVVLLAWWRFGGLLILIAVQIHLLFTDPVGRQFQWSWTSATTACLVLVLVALVERVRALRRSVPRSRWKDWSVAVKREFAAPQASQLPSNDKTSAMASLKGMGRFLAGVLCAIVISLIILGWVPYDLQARNNVRLRPSELRGIFVATLLAVVFSLISAIVSEIVWRKLTPSQARAYLRGSLANWIETDWRSVVRQRQRWQRRRKNTNSKTESKLAIPLSQTGSNRVESDT